MAEQRRCPACGSASISYDTEAFIFCESCGFVINDVVLQHGGGYLEDGPRGVFVGGRDDGTLAGARPRRALPHLCIVCVCFLCHTLGTHAQGSHTAHTVCRGCLAPRCALHRTGTLGSNVRRVSSSGFSNQTKVRACLLPRGWFSSFGLLGRPSCPLGWLRPPCASVGTNQRCRRQPHRADTPQRKAVALVRQSASQLQLPGHVADSALALLDRAFAVYQGSGRCWSAACVVAAVVYLACRLDQVCARVRACGWVWCADHGAAAPGGAAGNPKD